MAGKSRKPLKMSPVGRKLRSFVPFPTKPAAASSHGHTACAGKRQGTATAARLSRARHARCGQWSDACRDGARMRCCVDAPRRHHPGCARAGAGRFPAGPYESWVRHGGRHLFDQRVLDRPHLGARARVSPQNCGRAAGGHRLTCGPPPGIVRTSGRVASRGTSGRETCPTARVCATVSFARHRPRAVRRVSLRGYRRYTPC